MCPRGKQFHLPLSVLIQEAEREEKHSTPRWAAVQTKPMLCVQRSVAVQPRGGWWAVTILSRGNYEKTHSWGEAASLRGGLSITPRLQVALYLQA